MDQNGRRPSAEVLASWFIANVDAMWGENKPTYSEAKSHARSVRPTKEVRLVALGMCRRVKRPA
jgi:hypothetical protein